MKNEKVETRSHVDEIFNAKATLQKLSAARVSAILMDQTAVAHKLYLEIGEIKRTIREKYDIIL